MQQVFRKTYKDFKDMHLCDPCWNGNHFSDGIVKVLCDYHKNFPPDEESACGKCQWKPTHKKVCNCKLGECECPCSKMEQDAFDQSAIRKQKRAANKKAQMALIK